MNEPTKRVIEFTIDYAVFNFPDTEGYFSPHGCDCCNNNEPGTVHEIECINRGTYQDEQYAVCPDCYQYLANGIKPEWWED